MAAYGQISIKTDVSSAIYSKSAKLEFSHQNLAMPTYITLMLGMSIDSNQRVSYDATGQPLNYRNKLENYGAPILHH